ncbi:MAG: aspartate/glutamate racemase family protein [Rhizobiaceae bacterium]|nr:aspartate/glutamate racemase family protein [Rhizobiaceae bacterium]
MHIGLIGGIGPAATDFYYRRLIKLAAERERDLDLTIVHADTPTLLGNLARDEKLTQCSIYMNLTNRLASAGAGNVVVTSLAGHFCIDEFTQMSPLPVVDLTKILAEWLGSQGLKRVGILGTETVMSSGMYGKLAPVEVLAPQGNNLHRVHEAYITLAQSGQPNTELRDIFIEAGEALVSSGAEAILLGGTDLNAIFFAENTPFPIVDCASIHVQKIAEDI